MSKTNRDSKTYLWKQMCRRGTPQNARLAAGFNIPRTSEQDEAEKELTSLTRQMPDYHKFENRHSAAHRHSAIKTHKRVTRRKKHSEKQQAVLEIKHIADCELGDNYKDCPACEK